MESSGGLKRCPDCGEIKELSAFGRDQRTADGLARYRKDCFRARSTAGQGKRAGEPRHDHVKRMIAAFPVSGCIRRPRR